MAVNSAVRVGIIIFIALIIFSAVAWFLTGYRIRLSGYPITVMYDDAQGLTKGSVVQMAGVAIGVVDNVSLDANNRAEIRLFVNRKYCIPRDSRFILRVGLLVGEKYIDIVPSRSRRRPRVTECLTAGGRVEGEIPPSVDDLMLRMNVALDHINKDVVPRANTLMESLTNTSRNVNKLLGDKEMQARFKRSMANIEMATSSLNQTMAAIHGTVVTEKGQIREIVTNVRFASENLRDMTGALSEFAKEGGVQENLAGTFAAVRGAAESLERTTRSVESLTTAPEFQQDIRETVRGAREAIEKANIALDRLNKILEKGGPSLPRLAPRQTSVDGLYRPDDGRFRFDLSTRLAWGHDRLLELGLYDAGVANKLILEPVRPLSLSTDLRYGIYASRLGVGLDHSFTHKVFGTADLYDTSNLTLDVKAGYNLDDHWGLLLGADKVLEENQLVFGARYTK